jgi:hypothetical protein
MPIGPPEGFLDITNATLRTSVVGISNTGPTGELSVGSNLHVNTTASNVLQVVGNVSAHNMTLGEIRMIPAHGLENVTEVGNTTPFTVSFSNATTGLATTSNLHVGGTLKIGTVEFENPLSLAAVSLVSNTTPYTIEFSNAATGIATTANVDVGGELVVSGNATVSSNLTVTGNATVTGDLNVSGALGILDVIYPVGSIIDRATAITDTHLDGKFKAFLAAPNQRWELLSSPIDSLSNFHVQYNGGTVTYSAGSTIPFGNTIINIGSDWNSSTNKFVAPVSGEYIFGVAYLGDDPDIAAYLAKTDTLGNVTDQGDLLNISWNPSFVFAGWHEHHSSRIVSLNAGESVHLVQSHPAGATIKAHGTDHTGDNLATFDFFGFKIGGTIRYAYHYKRIAD